MSQSIATSGGGQAMNAIKAIKKQELDQINHVLMTRTLNIQESLLLVSPKSVKACAVASKHKKINL